MKKGSVVLWILILAGLVVSCSIKPPEVRVTGEMTALEKEVLGTYREIEQDTWMVASTRSSETGKGQTISPEKKRVLDAKRRQKFNQDDVVEMKTVGLVGENNQGFLEVIDKEKLQSDSEKTEFVATLVTEENEDREVIVDRVIELNENLKDAVRENILAIFAEMNQKNSPIGTWIQDQVGKWMLKSE
jgi:uncharacterized protein YdbL (DUF1318 family)